MMSLYGTVRRPIITDHTNYQTVKLLFPIPVLDVYHWNQKTMLIVLRYIGWSKLKTKQVNLNIVSLNTQGQKLEECRQYMLKHNTDILCVQEAKIPTNSFFKYKEFICVTSTDINDAKKTDHQKKRSLAPDPSPPIAQDGLPQGAGRPLQASRQGRSSRTLSA